MSDRGESWFFFFPLRGCYIIFPKDGPLVQPTFSDQMLAEQVKTGWHVFAGHGEQSKERSDD